MSLLIENKEISLLKSILQKTCNLDKIDFFNNQDKDVFPFLVDKYRYFIPLTFHVDSSFEIKRIQEEIEYLNGFLKSINKKLSNDNFITHAPEKVIAIEEKKKKDTTDKLKSLKNQLNSFDGFNSIHSK